jgi:hypothetical protein
MQVKKDFYQGNVKKPDVETTGSNLKTKTNIKTER